MTPDKTDSGCPGCYQTNIKPPCEKQAAAWIKRATGLFLYAITVYFQISTLFPAFVVIIIQLQIILALYLVISLKKKGYIISVVFSIIPGLTAASLWLTGTIPIVPVIAVPLGTIITITIIARWNDRQERRLNELRKQINKQAITEEVITKHNKQLQEANRSINKKARKLSYLAFFDVLTELPNRRMIIDRLQLLISRSQNKNAGFAIAFIDLDNFKNINDSLGHHAGDLALQYAARKLKTAIHPDDILGRFGGDEFALIIHRQLQAADIFDYVEQVNTAVRSPFAVEGTEFMISASFGIAIYPQHGNSPAELLRYADTAMYKAKRPARTE
ncbi:diguanylate cyclase domain-containing protein [Sporomusa aerivorans]|uniref:diguanylate cyclase domain-containing protein n=1 Tax=Sporomusa aerivorans TaxID=204936 RepID=UPI003529F354